MPHIRPTKNTDLYDVRENYRLFAEEALLCDRNGSFVSGIRDGSEYDFDGMVCADHVKGIFGNRTEVNAVDDERNDFVARIGSCLIGKRVVVERIDKTFVGQRTALARSRTDAERTEQRGSEGIECKTVVEFNVVDPLCVDHGIAADCLIEIVFDCASRICVPTVKEVAITGRVSRLGYGFADRNELCADVAVCESYDSGFELFTVFVKCNGSCAVACRSVIFCKVFIIIYENYFAVCRIRNSGAFGKVDDGEGFAIVDCGVGYFIIGKNRFCTRKYKTNNRSNCFAIRLNIYSIVFSFSSFFLRSRKLSAL